MGATSAAFALAPGAGAAPVPSEVEVLNIDQVGPDDVTVILGIVIADNRRCVAGRKVQVSAVTPAGDIRIDAARTGAGGGWQARDTEDALVGSTALKLRLERKTVKRGKKTIKCDGETVQLT